jgi:uncharacterized damage-inducible protein DinB
MDQNRKYAAEKFTDIGGCQVGRRSIRMPPPTPKENRIMTMANAMAMELEQEAKSTRKMLERLKEETFDWKPHEKSMTMGRLASHVVDLLEWAEPTLRLEEMDLPAKYEPWIAGSRSELLERFDSNVRKSVEALKGYPDEKLLRPWTLRSGETVYFTMPRAVVMRSFVLNHLVHHRGQLSVYIRLHDIPVPSIYGPSADES